MALISSDVNSISEFCFIKEVDYLECSLKDFHDDMMTHVVKKERKSLLIGQIYRTHPLHHPLQRSSKSFINVHFLFLHHTRLPEDPWKHKVRT